MATSVRSVYVHAPFCARRCFYCDFAVKVSAAGDHGAWGRSLEAELRIIGDEGLFVLAERLDSLYVGGGTPSLLGPGAMSTLGEVIGEGRLTDSALEWTAEANPESLSGEIATEWRAAGANRLSLGVQTFHEPALRWMGRLHGPDAAAPAVARARAAGFSNMCVDLIFGLPRHLARSWEADLHGALELDVPHISLYGLSIEERTPLGRAVREGRESPVDEEQYGEEFLMASEVLSDAGYEHYEVSNFARPGFRARHNAVYWEGTPYLGLGNGAHSYAHPMRRWNTRDWDEYEVRVAGGRSPESARESLGDDQLDLERIWLGLRTVRGLPRPERGTPQHRTVDQWVRAGWAEATGERIRLTPRGWLLLDRLAVDLAG